MKKVILGLFISLAMITLLSTSIFAQNQLKGRVIEVPAGRSMDGIAITGVSSAVSGVGDPVSVRLDTGFYDNGMLIFPAGTLIEGKVTEVSSAGRTGKNGIIGVRFSSAVSPSGHRIPISAIIETRDGTGLIRGGTLKGRIGRGFLRAVEGAAAGAVLGTAMGGITKGKVGRGAAIGTAIGGGIGATTNFTRRGKEAEIKSGKHLELLLTQPIRVSGVFR